MAKQQKIVKGETNTILIKKNTFQKIEVYQWLKSAKLLHKKHITYEQILTFLMNPCFAVLPHIFIPNTAQLEWPFLLRSCMKCAATTGIHPASRGRTRGTFIKQKVASCWRSFKSKLLSKLLRRLKPKLPAFSIGKETPCKIAKGIKRISSALNKWTKAICYSKRKGRAHKILVCKTFTECVTHVMLQPKEFTGNKDCSLSHSLLCECQGMLHANGFPSHLALAVQCFYRLFRN